MKKLMMCVFLLAIPGAALAEVEYNPCGGQLKPLCMHPQVPVCVCDEMGNCAWLCGHVR